MFCKTEGLRIFKICKCLVRFNLLQIFGLRSYNKNIFYRLIYMGSFLYVHQKRNENYWVMKTIKNNISWQHLDSWMGLVLIPTSKVWNWRFNNIWDFNNETKVLVLIINYILDMFLQLCKHFLLMDILNTFDGLCRNLEHNAFKAN